MTDKEYVLSTMQKFGRTMAQNLQSRADGMTGTELYAESDYIPSFAAAVRKQNMLTRPVGFVCQSPTGRIVRLLQPYDSSVFTQIPEELVAQWGFVWSKDPTKALPFIALATAPYGAGDCCVWNDVTYRSKIDNNVFSPADYPQGWDEVK